LILYSEAITLTRDYVPFGELGGAVLTMIGATEGIHVPDSDILMVKEAIATLPAHAEVPPALSRLRTAGFRIIDTPRDDW
jgi:2-haloacid dehalogenase